MNIRNILKTLYGKYKTYALQTLPYRQYIFEVKFKNIDDIAECKSPYVLSISFETFLEELYEKGHILIDAKQYSARNIEYTKLIKTIPYYAYVFDSFSDKLPLTRYKTLKELSDRQKKYMQYAKYLSSKELKKLINNSKIFYV